MSIAIQHSLLPSTAKALASAPIDQQRWIDTVPGESIGIRIRSEDVGGNYTVIDSIAQPGAASPLHYHAEDEIFRVLEGVMTFSLAGELIEAGPESVVVVPAGIPDCWKNYSNGAVRMSTIFAPGGIEVLFEQMSGKPPEDLDVLAKSFGTVIVGPPLA